NLRTSIQDYITNNQVTVDNVNNHIANINNLVSSVKTTNNQNLGNFVGSVTYSNNAFTIPLNSNCKMNVRSLSNIQINVDSIVMNNFIFYTKPSVQESPEDWFTWNGSQITGLTSLGKKNSVFVLPSKTESISSSLFDGNWTVSSIDMSLTKIKYIQDGFVNTGGYPVSFCSDAKNLNYIALPPHLIVIGSYAFYGCNSLLSITIPNSVTTIGTCAFRNCFNLKSITMSSSVVSIANNTFNVSSTCVMTIKRGWNTDLATNAGFTGTFKVID
ncbi:MAG: leucine-rich repeat domain-containing protein, partial [Ureaplasma sp.]|nr:leucine-rich repeat domain-containing protein [Ureaplasma sp.]